MQLPINDKLLLVKWIRTKSFFQNLIAKLGEGKTITYYLKGKSPKRLSHILWALKRRLNNSLIPSNSIKMD